jgi:hypothetical protein
MIIVILGTDYIYYLIVYCVLFVIFACFTVVKG